MYHVTLSIGGVSKDRITELFHVHMQGPTSKVSLKNLIQFTKKTRNVKGAFFTSSWSAKTWYMNKQV